MDFTYKKYEQLLVCFREAGYYFTTFEDYILHGDAEQFSKCVILRHDVDRYPTHALRMAEIEEGLVIRATYYFRTIASVFKTDIIKQIHMLGHEIGYHYEDLSICKGNNERALEHFNSNLGKLRRICPVSTICMHGSPLSRWDNKTLWNRYDYRNYGIIADTSLDVNYNEIFYISDNGRGWNKTGVSIRDKVQSEYCIPISGTNHLIKLIQSGALPHRIMINVHPDTFYGIGAGYFVNWAKIVVKNAVKWIIVKFKLIK